MKDAIVSILKKECGVTAIVVAVFILFVGIGVAAFAIDFGYRHVARNELQNAADAGALAGARALYYDDGTWVNWDGGDSVWTQSANEIAYYAATANKSAGTTVELYEDGDTASIPLDPSTSGTKNKGDIQRGHWSFGLLSGSGGLERGFYPRDDKNPVTIAGISEEDLDNDKTYINAVKVITRRQVNPVRTFFGKIFGHQNFIVKAESVAYIGFAGTLEPEKVDQPIAICQRSLFNDANHNGKLDQNEKLTCNIGRMIDSGGKIEKFNTGGWTDFNQEGDPCKGGTNAPDVISKICAKGNPQTIIFGKDMATNGGQISNALKNHLIPCWESATNKNKPWPITLPVIDCQDPNVGTCEKAVGAVTVNVIWIIDQNDNKCGKELPAEMNGVPDGSGGFYPNWTRQMAIDRGATDDCQIWKDFADNFNLKNLIDVEPDGDLVFGTAPYAQKSIYFAPNCSIHDSGGTTGGTNFGVSADIPVIVNKPGQDKLNLS